MKKQVNVVKEYVKRLSDYDFKYLHARLTERYGGDIATATEFIQRDKDMDRWLATATSADEFYEMIDKVTDVLKSEAEEK